MMTRDNGSRSGFTLVEILLVVAILGVLAGIVVVMTGGQGEKARITATRITLDGVKAAIDRFEMEVGRYPTSLEELIKEGDENWPGPFLDQAEVPKDAWGTVVKFERTGKRIRVSSAGGDTQFGTPDDLWTK